MEYERALFRVYDKSLESLRHNSPILRSNSSRPKTICALIQAIVLGFAILLICFVVVLHHAFVNTPGCLEHALMISAADAAVLMDPYNSVLGSSSLNSDITDNADSKKFITLPSGYRIPGDIYIGIRVADQSPEKYSEAIKAGALNASDFEAEYSFSFDEAILGLDEEFRISHNFTVLNTTIDRTDCFGTGFAGSLLAVTGYDVPIINQLMFTFRNGGLLYSEKGEEWWWADNSMPPVGGYGYAYSLWLKLLALTRALITFALLSSTTALVVRMLLSSGVVVMFPLFSLLRWMGVSDLDERVLFASYPWIGQPIQEMRNRGKPIGPFILAHVMQVIVYYTLYNAAQFVWTVWLYNKSISTALEVSLFAMMLLWEYFCLVFVRSSASITFFPKATAIYFTAFHLYFFYCSRGFFSLAAGAMSLMMLHAMLYTISNLEVPASIRGEISFENPRACYVELPWPSWGASMPPTWTLFLPPNTRVRGIYEVGVPSRPERVDEGSSEAQPSLSNRRHRNIDDIESG